MLLTALSRDACRHGAKGVAQLHLKDAPRCRADRGHCATVRLEYRIRAQMANWEDRCQVGDDHPTGRLDPNTRSKDDVVSLNECDSGQSSHPSHVTFKDVTIAFLFRTSSQTDTVRNADSDSLQA